ncbi:DUF3800 domain-containing protein [Bradyrhizobium japonicum]|uniref:DUF3800 domain-containing protein n=1 Tax=Bradyrhizobium japonicum TaxID=375 RepID=UPI003D9AE1B9
MEGLLATHRQQLNRQKNVIHSVRNREVIYPNHFVGDLEIVIDARTKELQTKNKFDGYLETRLVGHCAHEHSLSITHGESHLYPGLQAVDFLSWTKVRAR